MVATEYVAPAEEDRLLLWRECFEASKHLEAHDIGLLLYYGLQAIHLFADGNGRTGRLLFEIFESSEGGPLTAERLDDLLRHEGVSGPGREMFAERVKSPDFINRYVQHFLAVDLLGEDFVKRYSRIYNQQSAYESVVPVSKVSEPIKSQLESYLQEQPSGGFAARDVALLLYMKRHGLESGNVEEVQDKDNPKMLLSLNSEPVLQNLDEAGAVELLELLKEYKRQYVRKIIDLIARPAQEQYTFKNGETLKDRLIQSPLKAAA